MRVRASAVIPATVTFENVTRRFDGVEAISNLSFTIGEGEVICLLGASGCGKSTLLRLAAGIERPDEGRILLDGREIAGPDVFLPPQARGIGLVFQDYALFPHLDALGNVMFGLSNLKHAEARKIAEVALRRVGLGGRLAAMPHELSGGEQQRVALARAIVPRPRVLLMDEPFSNLDRRMRDQVREDTLTILRETGATALIVTHDPEEAMRLGDRIALLRQGRLIQLGTGKQVYTHPVDVEAARFFCDLNEFEGAVRGGMVSTPLGVFPAPGRADGTPVLIAIRPQSIRLKPKGYGLPARILSRAFLGEVEVFDLALAGVERPIRARMQDAPPSLTGPEVGVEMNMQDVMIF